MKVKDLLDFVFSKVQLYYKTENESKEKDSRTYIEIGEPCYIHNLPEKMLGLEVLIISPRDSSTLEVRVNYKE